MIKSNFSMASFSLAEFNLGRENVFAPDGSATNRFNLSVNNNANLQASHFFQFGGNTYNYGSDKLFSLDEK